eukprot:g2074.t1
MRRTPRLQAKLQIFNLNFFQFEGVACSVRMAFIDKFALYAMAPAFLIGCMCFFVMLAKTKIWWVGNPFRSDAFVLKATIWMFFLVYPQMCNIILSMLYCKPFHDGSWWLVADMNVRCDSPDPVQSYIFKGFSFAEVRAVAIFFTALYPAGVPVFFTGVLLYQRDTLFMPSETVNTADIDAKIVMSTRQGNVKRDMARLLLRHTEQELDAAARVLQRWAKQMHTLRLIGNSIKVLRTQAICGSLYLNYEPQFFWWESLELVRKLILTGAIIFIMPETPTQLAAGCLITLSFMVLYSYAQPYEDLVDDVLQLLCQIAIFTNYFFGLLLMVKSQGSTDTGFTNVLIIMNIAPFFFGMAFICSWFLFPVFRRGYENVQLLLATRPSALLQIEKENMERVKRREQKVEPQLLTGPSREEALSFEEFNELEEVLRRPDLDEYGRVMKRKRVKMSEAVAQKQSHEQTFERIALGV